MLKSLLRRRPEGQLLDWTVESNVRRARSLRAVVSAGDATPELETLVGTALRAVDVDFDRLYLQFEAGRMVYVVLNGPVAVMRGGLSVVHEATSKQLRDTLRGLNSRAISAATIEPDGALRLELGETVLRAEPCIDHEAWEIRSFDGRLAVSLPGGQIAVWEAAVNA